jgi:nucleotide-binding universal stress UspA family protein
LVKINFPGAAYFHWLFGIIFATHYFKRQKQVDSDPLITSNWLLPNWVVNNHQQKGGTMFKRILIALKFTPASQAALEKGIEIASENGAELHIFHAQDFRLQELDVSDPKRVELNQATTHRFDTAVKSLLNGSKKATFGCRPADPALEICKLARNNDCDLIILGSHQHAEKKPLGRINYVGNTILEKAPCPVMLVPL